MIRKLYKKELDLWKEVTKNDVKINKYISEDKLEIKLSNVKREARKIENSLNDLQKEERVIQDKIVLNNQKPQVNRRMKAKLERGLLRPEAILDLHGFNRVEGHKLLESFIKDSICQQKRCVLVVTGKRKTFLGSKSILRELVPKWLNEKNLFPYILAHSFAIQKDGGDGARYILLRKKENYK